MLIKIQQIQQLQGILAPEDTQDSSDSSALSFAGILADLLGDPALMSSDPSFGNPVVASTTKSNTSLQTNHTPFKADTANQKNQPNALDAIFESFALKYGLQPNLLKSVAKIESNYNPQAISEAGAQGVMQLMPRTAAGLGVKNTLNAVENIEGGAKYLRQLLDHFDNNIQLALAAYNAGPGAVTKYGGIPPYKETQNYVKKVLDNMVDLIG
ncbi:MAG: lytic transglycosylase domain-containing protein [Carboxydocellales bacterium]